MFNNVTNKQKFGQNMKKKPPPRPPPPNLSKMKSKSAWNLNQVDNSVSLIEWSPPTSPRVSDRVNHYGGSAFSSFSSSTSSLASSKRSFEYESAPFTANPWSPSPTTSQVQNSMFYVPSQLEGINKSAARVQTSAPTIIRPQQPKPSAFKSKDITRDVLAASKPVMPTLPPPPSPPKGDVEIVTPYGIALFDFPATQPGDLSLQTNDIVILIRRVNSEWLYGRVDDREGIFPSNFIEILVPLPEEKNLVTALYDFKPEMIGDLELTAGRQVKVIKRISHDWLFGEANGACGQFPANYVNRIPKDI